MLTKTSLKRISDSPTGFTNVAKRKYAFILPGQNGTPELAEKNLKECHPSEWAKKFGLIRKVCS